MFRFTIRDLLLVTLVVALGLGWAIREWKLRAELDAARLWRGRAGALQHAVERETGLKIYWEPDWVRLDNPSNLTRQRVEMAEPREIATR